MIVPRYYQEDAITSIFDYFKEHETGNPIVALPTGTGKSIVIGGFIQRAMAWPGQRYMMLTHVKELIQQNHDALLKMWPQAPTGIYSAGLKKRQFMAPITFAGIGSVAKKAALFGKIDLIFIDECHLVSPNGASMYRKFIAELLEVNPRLRVIGFTATPFRSKGGRQTQDPSGLFSDVCCDCCTMEEFNKLVDEGFISPLIPKRMKTTIDTSDVKLSGGDYIQKALQAACDKEEITQEAVKEMIEFGENRKHWLVFGAGIEHCEHISEELNARGIKTMVVHSKMKEDRADVLEAFKSGHIRCVVNNNVLTTGFDFKAIDLIGMMRPTRSPGLWVQMLGRGTRPETDKLNCLVLDFAGNTARLGPINDPVMPGRRRKKTDEIIEAPCRTCPECDTMCHCSCKVCPECGYEYPEPESNLTSEASELELIARPQEPEVIVFDVDQVVYCEHTSRTSGNRSLKVTYHCGVRTFNEWVQIESQRMGGLVGAWWAKRSPDPIPDYVSEALHYVQGMKIPKTITVLFSGKYPEVVGTDFGGDVSLYIKESIPF